MNDLQAIKARRDAITPGVWRVVNGFTVKVYHNVAVACSSDDAQAAADATFIAAAPADIDTLLAEVERLTNVVIEAQSARYELAQEWRELRAKLAVAKEEVAAQAADLAYLRSYVHALERYVPEASRRVAAGEARQQGEAV